MGASETTVRAEEGEGEGLKILEEKAGSESVAAAAVYCCCCGDRAYLHCKTVSGTIDLQYVLLLSID